ncbi:MAG: VOC family protein [Rikenellaceae bacterium]|jgi:PhnB protein|nr:VOC family protein [Rikenellaceae bacterium]
MIVPFLNFAGRAAEAIAFYESVFTVDNKQMFLFDAMPAEMRTAFLPVAEDFVVHAEMDVNGTRVWIGDSTQPVAPGEMVSIAVPLPTVEKVVEVFDRLKEGGKALMAPEPTFYSPMMGTVQDRFGVIWHTICQEEL